MIVRSLAGSLALLATLGVGVALAPSASAQEVVPVAAVNQIIPLPGPIIDFNGDEDEEELPGTGYLDEELEWELMTDEERAQFEQDSAEDEALIQRIREQLGDEYS